MNKYKLLKIGFISIIVLSLLVVAILFICKPKNTEKKGTFQNAIYEEIDYSHKPSGFTTDASQRCRVLISNTIVGKWEYYGGNASIQINNDHTFTLKDFIYVGYMISGRWDLGDANNSLKLKFDELDGHWSSYFDEDLSFYGESVVSADKESKSIEFDIGAFAGRAAEFKGECEENRFYINIFNNLYYKVI